MDLSNSLDIASFNRASGKKKKGGNIVSWKHKYNKKYGYKLTEPHSLKEISKDTGVSLKGIQQIYNKGIGAFKTNPSSVRPNVRSKEQWAMARVYSSVMGGKASKVDAKELKMEKGGLTKGKSHDEGGMKMVVKSTGQRVELEGGEGVLNKKVMSDDSKYEFEGKDMTACDIASELNQQKGDGVAFECDDVEGKFEEGGSVKDFEFGGFVKGKSEVATNTDKDKFVYNKILNSIFDPNFDDYDYLAKQFYNYWFVDVFYLQFAKFIEGKEREYNGKLYPYGRIDYIYMVLKFSSTSPLNNATEEQTSKTKFIFNDLDNFKLNSKTDFLSKKIEKKIKKNFIERCQSLQLEIKNRKEQGYKIKNPHYCTIDVGFEKGYKSRTFRKEGTNSFPFVMPSGIQNKTLDCYKLSTIYFSNNSDFKSPPLASEVMSDYLKRGLSNTKFEAAKDFQVLLDNSNLDLDDSEQNETFFNDIKQNKYLFSIEDNRGQPYDRIRFFNLQKKPTRPFSPRDFILENIPPFILTNPNKDFKFRATIGKVLNSDGYSDFGGDKEAITDWFKGLYNQFFIEAPKFFNCVTIDAMQREVLYTSSPNFLDDLANVVFRIALENGNRYSSFVRDLSSFQFCNIDLHPSIQDERIYNRIFMKEKMFSTIVFLGVTIPYLFLFEGEINQAESELRQKKAKETASLKKVTKNIGFDRLKSTKSAEKSAKDLESSIAEQVSLFDFLEYPKDKKYIQLLNANIRSSINKFGFESVEKYTTLPLNLLEYYYNQSRQSPVTPLGKPCGLPTPNGGKSKLPLYTYFAVRSPYFKMFFGDWERAYEIDNYRNVSRVIDADTKEPRIMYHGVRKFVEGFGSFANMGEGVKRPYGEFNPPKFPASYFGDNKEYVEFYGGNAKNMRKPSPDYKGFYYSVFLNMRNPIDLRPLGFESTFKDLIDYLFVKYGILYEKEASVPQLRKGKYKVWVYIRNHPDLMELMKNGGFDGIIQEGDVPKYDKDGKINGSIVDTEYLTFYSSQIESASVKNNLYLGVFDDIRFRKGGNVSI